MTDLNWAALLPLLLLGVALVVYALVDIRSHEVKHLPKWAWMLICVFSIPMGTILYFLIGRGERSDRRS